jgi:hypothetical protein
VGSFVEADEVFDDGGVEVWGGIEQSEELIGPEGGLERDATVGGEVSEGESELQWVVDFSKERLKLKLLVMGPGLVLDAAEVK